MLDELVLTGDDIFLEEYVKTFIAEQKQKARAYDAQLWKSMLMESYVHSFWIDDFTCAIDSLPPDAIAIRRGLNIARPFTKTYNVTYAITVYTQRQADTFTPPPQQDHSARVVDDA